MRDLRHSPPPTTIEKKSDTSQNKTPAHRNVDAATIKNNPKVDAQLISDFYRLVDASQGIIQSGRGANYGLSHPLDSEIEPTDPSEYENSPSENSPSKVKAS